MEKKTIVVIGAGVAGLTTAMLLSKIPAYKIIVAAKHMPGDYDIEYASPWAGANYMPVSVRGTRAAKWDRNTWPPLEALARNHPEAGVHFQECQIYNRSVDASSTTADWFSGLLSTSPWFKDVVPNFRILPTNDPTMTATAFTSVCINTAIYLPWLVSQCLAKGVTFRRAVFSHIFEAAAFATPGSSPASLIVNCSGLGAASLGGVLDRTVVPARGQVVLVRNEVTGGNVSGGRMLSFSGTDDGPDEACYIMARAAGGGTILGGCYQKGCSESQPDPNLAVRIMRRAVLACPELVARKKGTGNSDKASAGVEGLDVVRHGVGLRPVREGGTRVEREKIAGIWVVHNYGAGGAGYQSSYGCAMDAVELVDEVLGQTEEKARL